MSEIKQDKKLQLLRGLRQGRAEKDFNKEEAEHKTSILKIKIAILTISLASVLLIGCLVLLSYLPMQDKHHLLGIFISSAFSIITLTIGFVAGSSIDRK